MRITPLALAAGLLIGGGDGWAQSTDDAAGLEPIRKLQPPPRGEAARQTPIIVRAQRIRARPDLDAVAEGDVEFRRAGTSIGADTLTYETADDQAVARGHVRITHDGLIYTGPELQLKVQRFEGYFLSPEFEFTQLGAGGHADRVDFIDSARAVATNALYTSCPRDGSGDPAWVLRARKIHLDFDANEGVAEGAVLRFLGTPILAAPTMSFPLTDERKSGWLPPSANLDSRSGFDFSVPYYWNIAPNRDATITPRIITRRGVGADGEFRYLEPSYNGTLELGLLPNDRLADRSREQVLWRHETLGPEGVHLSADIARVSDDGWWKDFPDANRGLTSRLLAGRVAAERPFKLGDGDGLLYVRVQQWQVLQGSDQLVTPPYERSPQIGAHWGAPLQGGFEASFETELNRFTRPDEDPQPASLTGMRVHALGALSRPFREPGWWITPQVSFNAATYRTDQPMSDGRLGASRFIPTASIDGGLEYERHIQAFGRELRQTLEPRFLYVNTPFRNQSSLPDFDAAAKDFNFNSIYSENSFTGVDRVSDSNALSAGVTSRFVDETTGAEAMRLGIVQRYLFRDQLVTAKPDGTPDGAPLTERFSDLLLLGSFALQPSWTLDSSVEYNADLSRPVRSIVGGRYSPGPFRTLSATYRFTRGLSEQLELGWQWPVYTRDPGTTASGCGGTWYAVGRVNYSMRDSRVTDSIVGTEYDAGCWIGRIVAERLSTGRSEATTRLMLQIEFVGLSRLGSNPLKALKDNIPGYRLLRDDRRNANPNDE